MSARVVSADRRDVWQPATSLGAVIGLGIIVVALLLALLGVLQFRDAAGGERLVSLLVVVLALVGAVAAGVLLRGLLTLRYVFRGDELVIEWMDWPHTIPLRDIVDVVFEPHGSARIRGWEPLWPGYHVSTVRRPEGVWHSWATQPPRRRVRIVTRQAIVALSPSRPIPFMRELQRRRDLAAESTRPSALQQVERASPEAQVPGRPRDRQRREVVIDAVEEHADRPLSPWEFAWQVLLKRELLGDQVASALLATGLLIPLIMAAYLYGQLEGLPNRVPLHWDTDGQIDMVARPRALWRLPLMALSVALINAALATMVVAVDRFLARLLLAATPVVQLLAFVALLRIIH